MAGVVSEFLICVLSFAMLRRHFPLKLSLGGALRIVFSALVMGLVIWGLRDPLYELIQNFNILVLIPLGGLVYGAMLYATGVISKERLLLLKKS